MRISQDNYELQRVCEYVNLTYSLACFETQCIQFTQHCLPKKSQVIFELPLQIP